MTQRRLLTIPISHFCEKARWALDRAGVDYVERRHIQLVHALVTDVSIAEIPKPMPIVMHQVRVIRLLRSRPKPQVKGEVRGWRLIFLSTNAPPRFAAIAFRNLEPPVPS